MKLNRFLLLLMTVVAAIAVMSSVFAFSNVRSLENQYSLLEKSSELKISNLKLQNAEYKGALADTGNELEEAKAALANASVARPIYSVRENNGKIAVFDADGMLIKTIDTPVVSLPQSDRDMLKDGIDIFTYEELLDVIEDYSY